MGAQNSNAGLVKPTLKIFYRIFCSMFLIDTKKHNIEKKLKSFVSFDIRFSGGNKNFIQNKRKNIIIKVMECSKIE